ncbi:hypothetical protein GGX14DRAFT_566612 [Mycena pura]|uniref:Uncharacterized protein n=1 Tax=Mycena pura TaxID=153505 RepID=A0AAD6VJN5_9AGAR|nr:hypothetical protein GGX14DRAFT_566612 [Mycena pura]
MHRPRNNVIATHPAARLRAACPAARPASRRPTCRARRLTDAANGGRHWAVTRRASGWRTAGSGQRAAGSGQRAARGARTGGQRAVGGARAGGMGDGRGSASGGRRAAGGQRAAGSGWATGGGAQAGNGRRARLGKRRKRRAADATGGGIGGGSNAGKVEEHIQEQNKGPETITHMSYPPPFHRLLPALSACNLDAVGFAPAARAVGWVWDAECPPATPPPHTPLPPLTVRPSHSTSLPFAPPACNRCPSYHL